jgi:RimJ/RimL family protein N-acetyltransferase
MKNFLLLFLTINILNAATNINEETREDAIIASPQRCLAPERGYIATEFFAFAFIRPDFAEAMAPAYGDPKTMQYLGNGSTRELKVVRERFSWRAQMLSLEQNPQVYAWGVITHDGVCGVAAAVLKGPGVFEVSRILLPFMQGRKQGRALLETMLNYLPDAAWEATAHPSNIASWKSQESAGFVFEKIEFVPEYNGPRIFQKRPSNTSLEGRTQIRFTYSGKTVSLAELMAQVD